MEDDKEGEGQWSIGFLLIVKTEGKTEEEIEEMFNTLQIEISYITEFHMEYEPEYDFYYEDYYEGSRTSVIAKIGEGGLVRNLAEEERLHRKNDDDSPGYYVSTPRPAEPLPTCTPQQ